MHRQGLSTPHHERIYRSQLLSIRTISKHVAQRAGLRCLLSPRTVITDFTPMFFGIRSIRCYGETLLTLVTSILPHRSLVSPQGPCELQKYPSPMSDFLSAIKNGLTIRPHFSHRPAQKAYTRSHIHTQAKNHSQKSLTFPTG